jgi:hypothetical protein
MKPVKEPFVTATSEAVKSRMASENLKVTVAFSSCVKEKSLVNSV